MYDDLVKTTSEHHDPLPSDIVQCFKFYTRTRASEESIAAYVAVFRALGQKCGFGDSLEDMVREQLESER